MRDGQPLKGWPSVRSSGHGAVSSKAVVSEILTSLFSILPTSEKLASMPTMVACLAADQTDI